MDTKNEDSIASEDAEMKNLLAQLFIEPSQEAGFEERFLYNFHERVVQSAVCQPTRMRVWDHLCFFFGGMSTRKLSYGSLALLTLSMSVLPWIISTDGNTSPAEASTKSPFSSIAASLSSFNDEHSLLYSDVTAPHDRLGIHINKATSSRPKSNFIARKLIIPHKEPYIIADDASTIYTTTYQAQNSFPQYVAPAIPSWGY